LFLHFDEGALLSCYVAARGIWNYIWQ